MGGLPASGVTAEQFIEWSLLQPKGQRYELSMEESCRWRPNGCAMR